ncbi:MAG TPA: polysaccharide pyruvyl transferase family protein [Actinoplanes sp.]|nr:polysaccharide pyruvyl transferase family protein [Actinoplanes sp.]
MFNAWHDDNKGDCAILHASLDLTRRRWPDAHIRVHGLIEDADPAHGRAFRHAPSAPVRFSPRSSAAPVPRSDRNKSMLHLTGWAAGSVALLNPKTQRVRDAVRDLEAVVMVGGSNVFDSGRHAPMSTARLLRVLAPARAALDLGIPTYFLGHTLGPFRTRASRSLMTSVGRAGAHFVLREELSRARAASLSIPADQVTVLPDVAFLIEPTVDDQVRRAWQTAGIGATDRYVVLAPRTHPYDDAEQSRSRRLAGEMAKLADHLIATDRVDRVVILPQVVGPTAVEDDRRIAAQILADVASDRVSVMTEDLAPRQLAAFYGRAELTIGVRLHAVILAMAGGAPVFAIEYFTDKTQGILEMAGLGDCWDRYDEFTAATITNRWDELSSAARRAEVAQTVASLRDRISGWTE